MRGMAVAMIVLSCHIVSNEVYGIKIRLGEGDGKVHTNAIQKTDKHNASVIATSVHPPGYTCSSSSDAVLAGTAAGSANTFSLFLPAATMVGSMGSSRREFFSDGIVLSGTSFFSFIDGWAL